MKLSDYARNEEITSGTAICWWQPGQITGFQQPSGTIMVTEEAEPPVATQGVSPVVIYAQVFLAHHPADLDRQVARLKDYCATRGSQVGRLVTEMGSGVNDSRRTFLALPTDPQIDPVVLAHQDRATCFGFRYFETLLELSSRGFEVAHLAKTDREELLQERSRIVSAMGARRYGPRRAKTQRELIGHRLAPGQE